MGLIEVLKKELENNEPNIENIEAVLKKINVQEGDLKPYIKDPVSPLSYGRCVLFMNDRYEATVINMPPNTRTPIHNHGKSIGCGIVLSGALNNTHYKVDSGNWVDISSVREYQKGDCFYAESNEIHSIANEMPYKCVSLNIYTPVITGENYYCEKES